MTNSASISIAVDWWDGNVKIPYAGESILINQKESKFSFAISNWNFATAGNRLALLVEIVTTTPIEKYAIATLDIQPRNRSDKLSTMFDIEGNWNLSPDEESEYFGGTGSAWLLIFDPDWFPDTGIYLEETIYPELNRRLKLEPIQAAGNMQLYRMTPRQ